MDRLLYWQGYGSNFVKEFVMQTFAVTLNAATLLVYAGAITAGVLLAGRILG